MSIRTTLAEVSEIIEVDSDLGIDGFIETASVLVDRVELLDTDNILTANNLQNIERWLAAHFYAHRDQQFASEKTGSSSATFQGQTGMGLSSTQWGQTAMRLDLTGTLTSIDQQAETGKKTVGIKWLGKPVSSQIDYEDRD
jgi:hypothetical protein|tara:strand:- start:1646 stop:2068 length:423 start_codon:yes stop_codon:yes gene_type:complete